MAEIVGGVGVSHVPMIGVAIDRGTAADQAWAPLLDGYETARAWVEELKPDVVVVIYNDHASAVSLAMVPTFAVGVAPVFQPADEGYGRRGVPDFEGDVDLAWHIVDNVVPEGFDLTVCQELDVDHGLSVPMTALFGQPERWPVQVIPILVNVVQQPTPSAQRCFDLGRAIRRAVEGYSPGTRVLVVGTGGMSHQLQGERAGLINQEFDRWFLSTIGPNPEKLTELSTAQFIDQAGTEGAELIMWLAMRGALGDDVETIFSDYHVPVSNTAAGLVTLSPGR